MKCPKCEIGDISVIQPMSVDKIDNSRWTVLCNECSNKFDIPSSYKVAELIVYNYQLQRAKEEGKKSFLSGKKRENPCTKEPFITMWEQGFDKEKSKEKQIASSFSQKKISEQDHKLLTKLCNYLITLKTAKIYTGTGYRRNIKKFLQINCKDFEGKDLEL